jgi:hypothetical protein
VIFVDYHSITLPRTEFIITFRSIEKSPQLDTILNDCNIVEANENTSEASPVISSLTQARFEDLDSWLAAFFIDHKSQYVDQAKENKLILSTLQLLLTLARFGFYRDVKKLERMIFIILDVLDGRNDAK